MPQYLVTMNLVKTDPLLPIDELAGVVRDAILPSIKALIDLQVRGKIVTGGYPVGQRHMVLIVEAKSEKELHKLLESLPISEVAETSVVRLQGFEELQRTKRKGPLSL
jgi:muconolactone delta-isomerase